jgi:DNA binding domain, excisionase family
MKLSVADAARLVSIPEEKLYGWIEAGNLPAQRIGGQYRINRTQLLEWATERKIAVDPEAFAAGEVSTTVAEALRAGGIHYGIAGGQAVDVLQRIVRLLPLDDDSDREMLAQLVIAREAFGTTSVGDGIAIPHVRNPIVLADGGAILALCLLESPIDLQAIDAKAIDTLFFLISPTVHEHLSMLAKLAWLLRNEEFRALLRKRPAAGELLEAAQRLERNA